MAAAQCLPIERDPETGARRHGELTVLGREGEGMNTAWAERVFHKKGNTLWIGGEEISL